MSTDDPFSNNDNDRTVIRPMPGGRKPSSAAPQGAPPATSVPPNIPQTASPLQPPRQEKHGYIPDQGRPAAVSPTVAVQPGVISSFGINPLVAAASPLLLLGARLRNSIAQDQISTLRNEIIQQLRTFEDKARADGCEQNAVLTARYLLCSFLDEVVLSTPWGSESQWSSQSLLSTFHNETWGGEKFFAVLEQQKQAAGSNLNVLELLAICLSFGFKGKYQLSDKGNSQLLAIQDELFKTIALHRGEFERELSPHWQGVPNKRFALTRYVPLWVVAALAGVLLLVVYGGFRFIINSTTTPIYDEINQLVQQRTDIDQ